MLLKQQIEAVELLKKCNQIGRKVFIRGTGKGAYLTFNELKNLEIEVSAFVDINTPLVDNDVLFGLEVLNMSDVYEMDKASYFIVCSQMDIHVYFDIRNELELHGLQERVDFYHFGNLGFSFLRQPEKQILNAPSLIDSMSIKSLRKRNLDLLNDFYYSRVRPILPQINIKYSAEKVFFSKVNLISNLSCSLKCEYCCAGCQYSAPKLFDPKQSIDDFDKILKVSKVLCAGILGGEIFLHPKISEFFTLFAKMKHIDNCECVEVFTNATVIPSDEALEAYNSIPIPKHFLISNYTGVSRKHEEFIEKLEKFGCKYEVFAPSNTHIWNHPGSLKERNFEKIDYTNEELKMIKQKCCDFYGGWTILEGKLYICGYNVYALYPKLKDYVDIRNCPVELLEQKLFDYQYQTETYDLCAYCRGTYYGCEKIPVAEQI